MTLLTWTDSLALQHPSMDATHEEFVALLAATDAALAGPEPELLARFEALVDHTVEHFAQEEGWMAASGFAPENCHAMQHQSVLGVMVGCAKRAGSDGGDGEPVDFEPLRMAVGELAVWFPGHAQTMDAALAQHLESVGFDAATCQCRELALYGDASDDVPAPAITGCGSGHCG
jgi:hemerythrin